MPPVVPPPSTDAGPVAPAGPAAAPMSNPTEQAGLRAQAMQGIQVAIKVLEAAILPLGATSPEGKKIISVINTLDKLAGPSGGPDLNQAEVKLLAAKAGPEGLPQPPKSAAPPSGPGGGMPMMGPSPVGI